MQGIRIHTDELVLYLTSTEAMPDVLFLDLIVKTCINIMRQSRPHGRLCLVQALTLIHI